MFGSRKACIHPYLTKNLCKISELGRESPEMLLFNQTLAPLFMYFIPKYKSKIRSGLLSNNCDVAIRACQLLSFKQREPLSIKYCGVCASEDIKQFGLSYWHRSHQIPGIETCSVHNVWLEHILLIKRDRIISYLFPIATKNINICNSISREFSEYASKFINDISNDSSCYKFFYYHNKLKENGYITKNQRVRRKKITEDFYEFTQKLSYPQQNLLPKSKTDYSYLSYLLSGHSVQHPFKHLIFGFWLSKLVTINHFIPNSVTRNITTEEYHIDNSCLNMLRDNQSIGEVSRVTGKSYCYIKALALRNSIQLNLKPKLLTDLLIRQILELARKGFHRNAIAIRHSISIGSVEQLISSVPGLVESRAKGRAESKRRRCKIEIIRYTQNNPSAFIKDIKSNCNAAYYWLSFHEKNWLTSKMPKPLKPVVKPRVDWAKRDQELVVRITDIFKESQNRLTRTQLDRELGGHGWLTKKKAKLPLSLLLYEKLYLED
jgi:hypothetical protein